MSAQTGDFLPPGWPPTSSHSLSVSRNWLDVLPSQAERLRDYQREQVADIATQLRDGHTRILAQAPTGAGKTHIIAAIVMAAEFSGLRVLVLAPRTRLVRQIHDRLHAFGLHHGVIAAPLPHLRRYSAKIQIASIDTLHKRAIVGGKMPLPSADVVLFDEAHLATAETRLRLLNSYIEAIRIGFTATPARKSGLSLSAAFDRLILGPTIKTLTAAGVLVPVRIFNKPLISDRELRAIPKDKDQDFSAGPLGEMMRRPKLVGDVITNWLRIAGGKRTLCFAVDKAHAVDLLQSFLQHGIAAEILTSSDDDETRENVIGRLESGQSLIVINCFLLSYGVDVPSVECIVLARPTRSLNMYLQMVGRGLRAAQGKSNCIVIDHGRVVEKLGLPDSDFEWSLDPERNVNVAAQCAAETSVGTEAIRTCGECSEIWLTSELGNACPSCGWVPLPRLKPVAVEEAELHELVLTRSAVTPADPAVEQFYREALNWTQKRKPKKWESNQGKVRAHCWYATQEKFKIAATIRMPHHFWRIDPLAFSVAVDGWMKYRDIRWARSRSRGSPA